MLVELGGGLEAGPGGEDAARFTNTVPKEVDLACTSAAQPHIPAAFRSLGLHPSANAVDD